MARLRGQDVTSIHCDRADGTAVDCSDELIELGDLGNPTVIVDTTTLTDDESSARGGSRGGVTGSTTFKLDDGAANAGCTYKMFAAAIATGTAKTITIVAGGLTFAYEVIYTNIVPNFTRDEEATMVLSWQQTGAITIS